MANSCFLHDCCRGGGRRQEEGGEEGGRVVTLIIVSPPLTIVQSLPSLLHGNSSQYIQPTIQWTIHSLHLDSLFSLFSYSHLIHFVPRGVDRKSESLNEK